MTKADEVVKARLAAQRVNHAAHGEQARRDEIMAGTQYLVDAIPRLLALLAQRDYPDAGLLSIPGPRRLFGRQTPEVEMAAWLLDENRREEGGSSVHMLSDGRLVIYSSGNQGGSRSRPLAVNEIAAQYSEESARRLLGRASKGVERLIKRYRAE